MADQRQQLTKRDIRAAMEYPKDGYPFDCTCAECGATWGSHLGRLCPSKVHLERTHDLMRLTALGLVPPTAFNREFGWAGTLFIPLLDTNENGRVYFDLVN